MKIHRFNINNNTNN